jgi:MFS family permease
MDRQPARPIAQNTPHMRHGAPMMGSGEPRVRTSPVPFFYGWIVVAVVFVTMALGLNARTAFSLLFPPILGEFGWDRGVTAGAFSFGFLVAAALTPMLGQLMDRRGPRWTILPGIVLTAAGLILATRVEQPWHLYLTLGVMVGGGTVVLGYTGQAMFLPNWFVRRRGVAMSIAFSGVGVGSIVCLPWLQMVVEQAGWRTACLTLGIVLLVGLVPLNLLLRGRPEDLGLRPDGDPRPANPDPDGSVQAETGPEAAGWTARQAMRTDRFWGIAFGYFCGLFAWYAVQVHQTKYLLEIGIAAADAAWMLGLVSLVAIPGQIALGYLSDRVGRRTIWLVGSLGFATCYAALLLLRYSQSVPLVLAMVVAQGTLGYGLTSVIGAIPAETFPGQQRGTIQGWLMLAAICGGAAGPWLTGTVYDLTGGYALAFWIAIAVSMASGAAVWVASPPPKPTPLADT